MRKSLKQTIGLILSVLMIFALLPIPTALAIMNPSVTLGNPTMHDGKYYFESAVISGNNIRTLLINFSNEVATGDLITLPPTPSGFTISESSNNYTKRINIDAEIEASVVQNYLRSVSFSLGSDSQDVQVVVSSEDIQRDTYYNVTTQHYYQFIPLENANETWITSYDAAKAMTYMGRTGYLATVTSVQEDAFIMALSGEVGWLGGTRMAYDSDTDTFNTFSTTGYWYWACGPEKGNHFYDSQYVTLENYETKDAENVAYYFNWNRPLGGDREPNSNLPAGENCLTTLYIGTGKAGTVDYSWNDRDYDANYWDDINSVYQPHGYIVEYGDSLTGDSGSGSDAFDSASSTLWAPAELSLGTPLFSSNTQFAFPDLTLSSENDIGVITVNVDKAATSADTITLPPDADAPGGTPTVVSDLNNLTKTIVFTSAQSAAEVQAYLRAILFTASPDGAQTVTITVDANTTTGLNSDMKLTAFNDHPDGTTHYYAYVDSSLVTWVDAYNAAKNLRLMGMTGYLPTITSPEENLILSNISTNAAWSGGTRLVFNGADNTNDGSQISDQNVLYASSFTKADADEKDYFYWACGPEAGLSYSNGKRHSDLSFGLIQNAFENAFVTAAWGNNQPDNYGYGEFTTEPCMQVNQPNSGLYLWNDLPLFLEGATDENRYYFVEFGGYTGTTNSIKQVADDPGGPVEVLTASASALVPASYSINYNLYGGTNPLTAPASYTYGAGATLPTPTKTGFTFGGWYTDATFNGSAATTISTADTGDMAFYAKWLVIASSKRDVSAKTITVTETSSSLFSESKAAVLAEANVENAFSNSVEVKVTNTDEDTSSFGFGVGTDVYPFDISLYIKGTDTKTKPASGYAVSISLPIPADLIAARDQLFIVHKADNGIVSQLASSLKQINGVWYLVFDAEEFSPYAMVVRNFVSYDSGLGLPYYLNNGGRKVFIGFAADGKYLAPESKAVMFTPNPKTFVDISGHWGKPSIDFVTEREIFVGVAPDTFAPENGMTRAMFATVIGRLYERSYGELRIPDVRSFTDCNYNDYYGRYVDWAQVNGIIEGVGGGLFQPDQQIKRQEMAAMLYRFAIFMRLSNNTSGSAELNYSDSKSIAYWAEDAALYFQEKGIIAGQANGSFAPTKTATRAEASTIIQRFIEVALK